MHDLNTISRLNAKAVEQSIEHYRGQGRWVLARYEGLHIASVETFSESTHAQSALDIKPANALQGERAVIFTPLQAHQVIGKRDQSEDRTLADYIARKEGSTGGVPVAQVNEN